jgi:hypothetical protein
MDRRLFLLLGRPQTRRGVSLSFWPLYLHGKHRLGGWKDQTAILHMVWENINPIPLHPSSSWPSLYWGTYRLNKLGNVHIAQFWRVRQNPNFKLYEWCQWRHSCVHGWRSPPPKVTWGFPIQLRPRVGTRVSQFGQFPNRNLECHSHIWLFI